MKLQLIAVAMAVGLTACTFKPASEQTAPAEQSQTLVVHEWGTFTSVYGTDGRVLPGLQHEEEKLPSFVYGRNTETPGAAPSGCVPTEDSCGCKCMEPSGFGEPLANVTQKLETPVLYFYGAAEQEVKATVDFPGGIISEWYPNATAYSPPPGLWSRLAEGQMSWTVKLAPQGPDFAEAPSKDPWNYARAVKSTPIQVGNQREQFIFYRGLGRFEVPLEARATADTVTLVNHSQQTIPHAFLLYVHAGGGVVMPLGAVPANGEVRGPLPRGGKERDLGVFVEEASRQVAVALESSGLYPDEAKAMVDTWSRSYFRSPGLRVLYVLPREWTETLLPLRLEPTPKDLVRTLVGRAEVLTPDEEAEAMRLVESSSYIGAPTVPELISRLGRFAEPKLHRATALASEPGLRGHAQWLAGQASLVP